MMNKARTPALVAAAFLLGGVLTVATVESNAFQASTAAKGLKPFSVLRLDKKGLIPTGAIPKVKKARNADRLGGKRAKSFISRCSPETVRIGGVCMMANPYPLENDEIGRSDYFFATKRCADLGGYLPSAAQLIGAAPYVKLAGRLDDNEVTASIDFDPTDGLKDRREMSADLTTTASGGRAAGSIGVSDLAKGDPKIGEPDPTPMPANPSPETLGYITVYDNHDHGGFGGAEPVGLPMTFRCAFNLVPGRPGGL